MANKSKKIKVAAESKTGRNTDFKLPNGDVVKRAELVRQIKNGQHPGYHVRKRNGLETPVSNPDKSKRNNLD